MCYLRREQKKVFGKAGFQLESVGIRDILVLLFHLLGVITWYLVFDIIGSAKALPLLCVSDFCE